MKRVEMEKEYRSREGFSLVEIIIVIAIMAILIGVITLAVLPNIQRSRESKDLQTLDQIASSVNIGIANAKLTTSFSDKKIYDGKGGAYKSFGYPEFDKAYQESLGDGLIELVSSAATDAAAMDGIYVSADLSDHAPQITVYVGKSGKPASTKYTSDVSVFRVTN